MKKSILTLAALLVSACAFSATKVSTFEVTYPYYDKNSTCTKSIIDILPLTLKFDRDKDGRILLVDTVTKNTALGDPLQFTKEGISGYIGYMSLGSTQLTINNKPGVEEQHVLQQLWLLKEQKPQAPFLSAFYLSADKESTDRDCLIMNDLDAAKKSPFRRRQYTAIGSELKQFFRTPVV